MIDEVASDPGSENQNRNWWQHFGNWISEHGDEHGFILGGLVFAGLIAGFILRECLSVRHSDKIPLTIGFISYFVTIAGLGVTNIFQPDISKRYSVAAQAACAFITAFSLG
ncbi:hypothetical protein FBF34_12420 [Arachnia propionica]|uniref:Uncharacterized protein n=1 Tax=Arachnia propionica TaxID=1750 RepID=A0AB37HWG3_9ACTN|nr:hypothetical protein [Arachnia propionica]QCT38693.1 hypothetical protein FBF34_12420 [Arachnia propionica]QUC11702.1 hypothetical protein J5A53_03105 [Arachnia propionica]